MRTDNTEYIVEKCESIFKDDHLNSQREAWICESKDVARFRIEEDAKLFGYFLDFDWIYDTVYFAKAVMSDGAKISVAYKIHVVGDGFDGEPYIHLKDAKRIFENAAWGYRPSHGSNRPVTDDEVELWEHAAKQIARLSRSEKLNAKKRTIDLDAAKQVVKNAIWGDTVPHGLDRMPTDEETELWLFTAKESRSYNGFHEDMGR